VNWTQFSSAGQVSAGNGLVKTGSVLDVVTADSSRIVVNSNDIDLATTGVSAGTYQSLTVDTYGRITSGTNPTTFAGYNISDTSANLAAAITDETGTGSLVFATDPALAGTPTAPTATALTNSTQIATTAYTDSAVSTLSATVQWENNSGEIRPTTDARDVVPVTDGGASLGTASLRWANVYTQDMHFSNEGSQGNSVDGTTGNWTLQEGEDEIYMINNKTGKTYSIVMKERS
jgi:phage-related tail fiber protein